MIDVFSGTVVEAFTGARSSVSAVFTAEVTGKPSQLECKKICKVHEYALLLLLQSDNYVRGNAEAVA